MKSEEIKSEAKKIMDNFMNAMNNIEVSKDYIMNRENCFREEGNGNKIDKNFRQRFLSNAPKISGDSILANKGDWV